MNSFLNPNNNGPSLTGVIDVTAHSISLLQEHAPPKNIEDIFIPKMILVSLCLMMSKWLN